MSDKPKKPTDCEILAALINMDVCLPDVKSSSTLGTGGDPLGMVD